MNRGRLPVFSEDPAVIPIKIDLIEPECHDLILRHPMLLIGIEVMHPDLLHHPTAACIPDVMSRNPLLSASESTL